MHENIIKLIYIDSFEFENMFNLFRGLWECFLVITAITCYINVTQIEPKIYYEKWENPFWSFAIDDNCVQNPTPWLIIHLFL